MTACPPPPPVRYPLSSVQREIWFDQALYPDTPVYNVGGYSRISQRIDPQVFRRAIERLIRECDVLRMVLGEHDGQPCQSFPELPRIDVPLHDCSQDSDPLQAALTQMQATIRRPFKLAGEPLLRYALYQLADDCFLWSYTYHHLVVDGWAISLITQRVAALYRALLAGDEVPVHWGASYRDFVASDTAYLASPSFSRHRDYWRQKFASLPAPLLAPKPEYAARRGVVPGAVHTCFLPRARYAQLDALAQANSVSVFHVLIGALYVYFTRTCDRDECVVGLPVLNRSTPEFKRTAGLFASMIPARLSLGRDLTFSELIQAIARGLRESYRYQRFPQSGITRLAGILQSGRRRLFDLTLSFEQHDYAADFGNGAPCNTSALTHGFEQTPLCVFVRDYSDAQDIQVDFAYNLAYFDAGEIGRIERRLRQLLDDVLDHPDAPIGTLDLLPADERRQLLVDWNATAVPVPETCVHQLFEAQVERTPEATAVVFEDETLSYAVLNARANQLAHRLIALGAKADERVAIALERSPAMIVALLAVLKAGAAYVPLDPDYPAERLAFMLGDCGARVLITTQALHARQPLAAPCVLCLDTEDSSLAQLPAANPDRPVDPRHLAYVIYTSGSTGKPKGVAIEQRSVADHSRIMKDCFALSSRDRFFQFASFSFDASVEQILPTLCAGATVVLPVSGLHTPQTVNACLRRHGVTVLEVTPAFFRAWSMSCDVQCFTSLRLIILAGEALTFDTVDIRTTWPHPGPRWLNVYGPTEATVSTSSYDIRETLDDTSVPIGRPLPSRRVYVLDAHRQPVPLGVAGELYIGGAGLARGYLNRPELTAEKFVADPFSSEPEARLYRSGDLVRYRPDGNLEFLGRIDHQVKIRGFRIELGEIEAALAAHPAIGEALVVARPDARGEQQLVAYLVAADIADPSSVPSVAELRSVLKATLPDYMLPAAFVVLETLPLTPNGKIDRKALPEPEFAASGTSADDAPRDALEEIVAGLYASVLGRTSLGRNAHFFELGGHSLLATQLASRLRDSIGIDVPVRWLFEAPSVAELAALLRPALAGENSLAPIPANRITTATTRITPDLLPLITLTQDEIDRVAQTVDGGHANVQDIYPLAPLQQGIFFQHQLHAGADAYLSHALLAFDSAERRTDFVAALQSVVDRHDILRTAFVWEQQLAEPVQVVWRQARLAAESRHFAASGGPIADQLAATRSTRIDLAHAPLLHITLADDGNRRLLLLCFHHLIMDHTTIEVMLDEIVAHLQSDEARLSRPVPFRNFVAVARREVPEQAHEAFFHTMLGDIETPTAPFGLLDVQGDGSAIAEARCTLPADLAHRLRLAVSRLGATPAGLCHLAWALVLARCCKQDKVVFGSVLFGRMQGGEGVERALGLFINTLPFAIDCGARPVAQALGETQRALLALMRHENAPLSLAQRCSSVPAPAPLFSTLLNFRHSPTNRDSLLLIDGVELLHAQERTNYPITLSVDDFGDGLALTVQIDAAIDPQRVVALMHGALATLATALEDAPQTLLCALAILPIEEHKPLPARCEPAIVSEDREEGWL